MKISFRAAATAALLALLGGCSNDMTGFPSLAPRKIEQETTSPAATAAIEPANVTPAGTSPTLAKIVAQAGAADASFRAELARSRKTIEAGNRAAMGSEDWITGQQAYSALDVLRGPVADALAELDRQRQQAVSKGEDESAIAAVTLQVQAIDEAERALLAELRPPAS